MIPIAKIDHLPAFAYSINALYQGKNNVCLTQLYVLTSWAEQNHTRELFMVFFGGGGEKGC